MARIAVVGLGNVLMGDDAFGPHVALLLDAWYEWPADVALAELGTQGLDLTSYVRGVDALVVVSSVHRGAVPGALHRLSRAEILDRTLPAREPSLRSSPYEPGVRDVVLTLQLAGGAPRDVTVIGATPASVELTGGLSDAVRGALAPAVAEVVRDVSALGAAPRPRDPRRAVTPWWESRRR
jgi:hydrogenase maturation protease